MKKRTVIWTAAIIICAVLVCFLCPVSANVSVHSFVKEGTVNVAVRNNSENSLSSAVAVIAFYKNGKFVGLQTENIGPIAGNGTAAVNFVTDGSWDDYKIFVWQSLADLLPFSTGFTKSQKPIISLAIPDMVTEAGKTLTIILDGYFISTNADRLTYSSDKGSVNGGIWTYAPAAGNEQVTVTAISSSGETENCSFYIYAYHAGMTQTYADSFSYSSGAVPYEYEVTLPNGSDTGDGFAVCGIADSALRFETSAKLYTTGSKTMNSTAYRKLDTPITGEFELSYDVKLIEEPDSGYKNTSAVMSLYNTDGAECFSVSMVGGTGSSNRKWRYTCGDTSYTTPLDITTGSYVPVRITGNIAAGTISIYINSEILAENIDISETELDAVSGISCRISLFVYGTSNAKYARGHSTVYFDNIAVLENRAATAQQLRIAADVARALDFADISDETESSLTKDLHLFGEAMDGTYITWTSSDKNTLTNEGRVICGAQAKNVLLTAHITNGAARVDKVFEVTVAAKQNEDFINGYNEQFSDTTLGASPNNFTIEYPSPCPPDTFAYIAREEPKGRVYLIGNGYDGTVQAYRGFSVRGTYNKTFTNEIICGWSMMVPITDSEASFGILNSNNDVLAAFTFNKADLQINASSGGRVIKYDFAQPETWYTFSVRINPASGEFKLYLGENENTFLAAGRFEVNTYRNYAPSAFVVNLWNKANEPTLMYIDDISVKENGLDVLAGIKAEISIPTELTEDIVVPIVTAGGAALTWSADSENLLCDNSSGVIGVIRPAVGADDINAALTATLSVGGGSRTITWNVRILANVTGDTAVSKDFDWYSESVIIADPNAASNERFYMPAKGKYGSNMTYSFSSPAITRSGNYGMVTNYSAITNDLSMTITFMNGNSSKQKIISMKHLQYNDVSGWGDKYFFGNGADTGSELNYAKSAALSNVKTFADKGDYENAKLAYYDYNKNTATLPSKVSASSKDYKLAKLFTENIYTDETYIGVTEVKNKSYDYIDIPVSDYVTNKSTAGAVFELIAREKNVGDFTFYSRESAYPPVLIANAGATQYTFSVSADTYISPGNNINSNYGSSQTLGVSENNDPDVSQTYHLLWSNDTKRAYLKFDVASLSSSVSLTNAKIRVYGKTQADLHGIMVFTGSTSSLSESSATWGNMFQQTLSWYGTENNWVMPTDGSNGVSSAATGTFERMYFLEVIAGAYRYTKDEFYAHGVIKTILEATKYNYYTPAFNSSLTAGIRAGNIALSYKQIVSSASLDKNANAAIVKYMWRLNDALTLPSNFRPNHNHGVFTNRGFTRIAMMFPEFVKYEDWRALLVSRWTTLSNNLVAANGSYREGSIHYASEALNNFLIAFSDSEYYGFTLADNFKDKIALLAKYIAVNCYPNGYDNGYGDGEVGALHYSVMNSAYNYTRDEELRYILTSGASGTKPPFTSKTYADGTETNRMTIMRDNWTANAMILQTNTGIGDGLSHTHPDNLGLTLYAFGKPLLLDPGRNNYNNIASSNWLRRTTEAHNTVTINGYTQALSNDTDNYFTTNDSFDAWQGLSTSVKEGTKPYNFMRSVLYVKSRFAIVSDNIVPPSTVSANTNTYEQNWHLRVDAGLIVSGNIIKSRFADNKNIIMAVSSTENTVPTLKSGYVSTVADSVSTANYASFKTQTSGTATIDTLLYPTASGAEVTCGKLSTAAGTTGMNFSAEGSDFLYFINYNSTLSDSAFGSAMTNAQTALVETIGGVPVYACLRSGSRLSYNSVDIISYSGGTVSDIAVKFDGGNAYIYTSANLTNSKLTLNTTKAVGTVYINGVAVNYARAGNTITIQ